jgi:hypothetical protein
MKYEAYISRGPPLRIICTIAPKLDPSTVLPTFPDSRPLSKIVPVPDLQSPERDLSTLPCQSLLPLDLPQESFKFPILGP